MHGVEGIIDAYRAALTTGNVQLHGPTQLAPVIEMASRWAAETDVSQTQQKYFILLILTDGAVSDHAETVRALVDASELPLSVLIVGIGDGNFGRLRYMNGDNELEDDTGRLASREMCQFVSLSSLANNSTALSQSLLAEVPGQMLEWMRQQQIVPGATYAAAEDFAWRGGRPASPAAREPEPTQRSAVLRPSPSPRVPVGR